MAYLTKMKLNGVSYDIRDAEAYKNIETINENVTTITENVWNIQEDVNTLGDNVTEIGSNVTILTGDENTEGSVKNSVYNNAGTGYYKSITTLYAWKDSDGNIIYTKTKTPGTDSLLYTEDGKSVETKLTKVEKEGIFIDDTMYTLTEDTVQIETDSTIKAQLDMLTQNGGSGEGCNCLSTMTADDVTFKNSKPYGPTTHNVDSALELLWEQVFYQQPSALTVSLTATPETAGGDFYVGNTIPSQDISLVMSITDPNGLGVDASTITSTGFTLTSNQKSDLASGKSVTVTVSQNAITTTSKLSYSLSAKSNKDSKDNTGSGSASKSISYNFYNHYYMGVVYTDTKPTSATLDTFLSSLTDKGYDKSSSYGSINFTANGQYCVFVTKRTLKSSFGVKETKTGYDVTSDWVKTTVNGWNVYITSTPKTFTNFGFTFGA